MIAIVKIISTSINNGVRFIKILCMGKQDIRSVKQIAPFGIDSAPTNDKRGLYTTTSTIGKYYSLGVINTNVISKEGETRMFSTDAGGGFKFQIHLTNDGEVLIGTSNTSSAYTNNAVKYNESKSENDKLKSTVDDLVTKWNAFCGSYVPGSPSTVGTPPTLSTSTVTPNTSNFSLIKNSKIKYND